MKITNSISNFTNEDQKYVLRVANNELNCLPLKETTLLDRVRAWFGYGPLSLRNIAEFILSSNDIGSITNKESFLDKFINKCHTHNQHSHLPLRKVSTATLGILYTQHVGPTYYSCRTETYNNPQKGGNCDFSYANSRGFAYVVDGVGHDNPKMATALSEILETFRNSYEAEYVKCKFESIKNAGDFFLNQIKAIAKAINTNTTNVSMGPQIERLCEDGLPAASFAQILKINGKKYLITAEFVDTTIFIHRATGKIQKMKEYGNGSGLGKDPINICYAELEDGDRVIGISDGIGEFLSTDEVEEVVNRVRSPVNLQDAFIQKIKSRQPMTNNQECAFNGVNLKPYNSENPTQSDDVSLFVLSAAFLE